VTITYRLFTADLVAAAKYIAVKIPSVKRQIIITPVIASIVAGAIILYLGYFGWGRLRVEELIFALVSAIFAYIFARFLAMSSFVGRFTKIASDGKPNFTRSITMSLEEAGIVSTSDLGTGTLFWSAIQEIDEDNRYIYIVLPSANVALIPKSAFSDQSQIEPFIANLKSHMKSSKMAAA
jgi:hypothetical protein